MPAITALGAFGLLLVALAYNGSRQSAPWALLAFWAGVTTMIAPIALRQLAPGVGRGERAGLVIWLGLSLYLIKVLQSPLGFALHDEFPHYRTANDILLSDHLFHINALQNVSALFPGMQIVVSAIAQMSGLPIYPTALIIIGAARLLATVSAFLIHERISGSARVAGVASLIYCSYPNFVYWSAQFGYESLALPLATAALFMILMGEPIQARWRWPWMLALMTIGAVVVSHHVTSYVMTTLLILLAVITFFHRQLLIIGERVFGLALANRLVRPLARWAGGPIFPSLRERDPSAGQVPERRRVGIFWIFSLSLVVIWLFTVAQQTIPYLGPHIVKAANSVVKLIIREESSRTLFRSAAPEYTLPTFERIMALACVGLIAVAIHFGLVFAWRRYRRHPMAMLLMVVGGIYPATLILRITSSGAEISNRSSDYLFIGVSFVVAVAIVEFVSALRLTGLRRGIATGVIGLILMGAIVIGIPPWARMPGPYALMGDTRGIQPESIAAADWARPRLDRSYNLVADKTNWLLMGSYGEQNPVETLSWIYFSPRIAQLERRDMRRDNVRYVVADYRITRGIPVSGIWFASGEPEAKQHEDPFPVEKLAKFDSVPQLSRIFDSGNIQIYDTVLLLQPEPSVSP
ncbi:hypothetical protein K2Z83_01245 [Oscillochloris sp. ZM17-4]|uniref:hypothetical protein n=1 Tax=Oscillochloris sp. ZM17-4 TaxID=2866714 RepID=UPI001C731435|nr:hypothetical protein [Oscillochloris sp. ZM17-4]MBX0326318.1 hypothetical protein [Oscillochloris sp. ZM17-4]